MRPRVDAHVVSAVTAEVPSICEEVLAGHPCLLAWEEWQLRACESELPGHARALAAAVDLRCPPVFREHARMSLRLHDAAGLPHEAAAAYLCALGERVAHMALPSDVKTWLGRAIDAGLSVEVDPGEMEPIDLWDAATAAMRGNRTAYLAAVEAWRAGRGSRVALLGIAEVQRQVGEAWIRHQATVLEEHRASALAQLGLSLLAPDTWGDGGPRRHGQAVLAASPGDFHSIGLQVAAGLLELEGYAVEVLGADTPAIQLAVACVERKPSLVGISVAAIDHLPAAREAVEMVRHAAPHSCIAVGGFAARAAGAPALGADVLVPEQFDGRLPTHPSEAAGDADSYR
jgi:methanogenic corrinoid protein MtbC1